MTFIVISICSSSLTIAMLSINNPNNNIINVQLLNRNDPPEWAMGTFNGTYGLLKHGNPSEELGRIEGYWESRPFEFSPYEKGQLQGEFFEGESLYPTLDFSAKLFSKQKSTYMSSIFYGKLTDIQKDKTYFLLGIGKIYYDGNLEYKIFTFLSSNYYVNCEWKSFY